MSKTIGPLSSLDRNPSDNHLSPDGLATAVPFDYYIQVARHRDLAVSRQSNGAAVERRSDMSTHYTGPDDRLHAAEIFRVNWLWLALLGVVLIAAGAVAILVPAVSTIAASEVLGSVLIVSGVLQIMQAAKMLNWAGFICTCCSASWPPSEAS